MRDGDQPTETIVDETAAVRAEQEDEDRRRRRVALMGPTTGYRRMGRRRKRELRDLRLVIEPGLRSTREQSQVRRRKVRADRKKPLRVDVHFDPDVPKGYLRDLPGIPPGLLEANEQKRTRR